MPVSTKLNAVQLYILRINLNFCPNVVWNVVRLNIY